MCSANEYTSLDSGNLPYTAFENSTYTVVSKVAYLIGVPKRIFENEHEPPQMEWYEKLSVNKNARIVRNLSILRTAIEQNFKNIYKQMLPALQRSTALYGRSLRNDTSTMGLQLQFGRSSISIGQYPSV